MLLQRVQRQEVGDVLQRGQQGGEMCSREGNGKVEIVFQIVQGGLEMCSIEGSGEVEMWFQRRCNGEVRCVPERARGRVEMVFQRGQAGG
ncbi:hypothetical protein KUCAC02_036984 [Chaenocephalus aceratus]|nr:hypothetical protein KUCAC02_036984 [Chaenocephalus aceratus]